MKKNDPSIMQMIRAPFLSSILAPLIAGSLLAAYLSGELLVLNFILVLVMGIGLHVATNVYNDIYDTIQGTDKINVNRNEFSGGSGVLLNSPHLFSRMYFLARMGLIIALLATIALSFLINKDLLLHLWWLYFLSAFFSKYYTAAPLKLAYRGWGEISVWFAFGPMAILVAAVTQNVGYHPVILAAMPASGISTLSILLIGQMIDLDADKATGKWGVAVRFGMKFTAYLYVLVQLIMILDLLFIGLVMVEGGWPILLALIPYLFIFPQIAKKLVKNYENIDVLKKSAKMNVQLHLLFSLLFIIGVTLTRILN